MTDIALPVPVRTMRGVGIVPGVGGGSVLVRNRSGRTGFGAARDHVLVCDDISESEVVMLVQARPAAIVVTGSLSHGVASVLRDFEVPVVAEVTALTSDRTLGAAAVVDGGLGMVWSNAVLVPTGIALK